MNDLTDGELLMVGFAGWLSGLSLMLCDHAAYSWLPISFGALALGYYDGKRHPSASAPADRS